MVAYTLEIPVDRAIAQRHSHCTVLITMSSPDHDKTAPRRQVGRHMLSLTKALSRVLAAFDRSKGDPHNKPEAREACDHALTELRRSMESLAWLRESLRASLQPEERATIS